MRVTISRKAHFNAAHRLYRKDWSFEKNDAVFGKCNNPNFHGHNYELIVSVTGAIDPETGYVMDVKILSDIIKEEVENQMDHKNLNLDVPFMQGVLASTENLVIEIWKILENPIREAGGELAKIKLIETENNFVEYYGGNEPY